MTRCTACVAAVSAARTTSACTAATASSLFKIVVGFIKATESRARKGLRDGPGFEASPNRNPRVQTNGCEQKPRRINPRSGRSAWRMGTVAINSQLSSSMSGTEEAGRFCAGLRWRSNSVLSSAIPSCTWACWADWADLRLAMFSCRVCSKEEWKSLASCLTLSI